MEYKLKYLFILYEFPTNLWYKILNHTLQNNLGLINFNESKLFIYCIIIINYKKGFDYRIVCCLELE